MTVILNPQNKRGIASFVASLVKNANTIFVLLSPHGPFHSRLVSGILVMFNILFLKLFQRQKLFVSDTDHFLELHFFKRQKLVQRTSTAHLVGVFPLR